MPERLVAGLTALFAASLVVFHMARKQRPDPEAVSRYASHFQQNDRWVGIKATDFKIETLDGGRFQLADHVGHEIVILNFFATWSAPSKAEMPELDRFARESIGRPVKLIAIDAEERGDVVRQFVRGLQVRLPVAVDESGDVLKRYGVDSFPTTVLIGPDGKIRLYHVGPVLNADVAFAEILNAGLREIADGKGISRDAFLADAHAEASADAQRGGESRLAVRASRIAFSMTCPCGCDRKVAECCCATAAAIKKRLAVEPLDGRADEEVIRDLGREFRDAGAT
jgi:cytochrome c biogenesis protein CcmG/thiol:disulfide interchange protein DsbE